jgi:hypothetical protein
MGATLDATREDGLVAPSRAAFVAGGLLAAA